MRSAPFRLTDEVRLGMDAEPQVHRRASLGAVKDDGALLCIILLSKVF